MQRLLFIFPVCFLLCIGWADAQDDSPDNAGQVSILQVVDSDPLSGEEIARDATITLYFDRVLDCKADTLQSAIKIEPSTPALNSRCESNQLIIEAPDEGYSPATSYTLTVERDLIAGDGASLDDVFMLEFNTVGFLRIVETLPADGAADIAGDATLTVIFNRPVVPLGIVEDTQNLPNPLTFSPDVVGQGEWLSTSIYTFSPEPSWAGGVQYTVTVDPTLATFDEAGLQESFSWSFSTTLPQVTGVMPEDAAGAVDLDRTIQVTFNQPMDQQSVEAAFALIASDDSVAAGTFEWADANSGLRFIPDDLLSLNTAYTIRIDTEAQGAAGGALAADFVSSFVTVPSPAIVNTEPANGRVDVPPYGGFTLYFASPMDRETLNDKVTINPPSWRDPDYFYQTYNNALQVSFPTEPSTTYTIEIAPGMADIYGNTIDTSFTLSYTTIAYDPDVRLEVPGPVGFYNANREQTQVFVTHHNVSRLDLSLYSVSLAQFVQRSTDENLYDPTEQYFPDSQNLLRSWAIESVAPQNARRYELLDLAGGGADGSGTAAICPGAPASRVRVGDTAIVITEPDPLRARSTPPDGEIVDLLYKDYVMPVVGGPFCDDAILWWEIQLRDESTVWVAEAVGDEYFIDLRAAGQSTEVIVPPTVLDEDALRPGIYYLQVDSPETQAVNYRPQKHFMVVGTANLALNISVDSVTVWATDVNTGQPIPDAPIQVYDANYRVVGEGVTDIDGLTRINIPRISDLYVPRMAVLQTNEHFGLGLTSWSNGIDPWQFGYPSSFYPSQYQLYMYTDRPIYRPDQPVYFRGVLRSKDDVDYSIADLSVVTAKVFDDRGEIIYERELELTEFGTFSDSFMLSDDAPLGFYRVVVDLPSQQRFQSEGGSVSFNVAEYRLPEYEVNLTPASPEVVQGQTITVDLESRYFFGGLVQNANVEYTVVANPYRFNYEGPGGNFDFVDFNPDAGPGEYLGATSGVVASGMGTTDAAGRLTIEVDSNLEDASQSQTFTIEAVVRDESDQVVVGRTNVVVHQGEVYIGARPAEYVGRALSDTLLEFIAVDWDSRPVADQTLDLEIVERRWSNVQEEDANGRTVWTWEVEEIPVLTDVVTTDENGRTNFIFIPPNGGIFQATIITTDALGNEVRASTTLWVSDSQYVSWRQQNSNRIDLIVDRDDYEIGDTAEILITSPFQGATDALITVMRGDVLSVERITMDSNSYVHDIAITEDFAPNVYVNVMLVQGVSENNPIAGFRMGIVQLNVDRSRKEIDILVTPDRDTAGPRETVTYTVQTRDYAGEPVMAEVGIALTDLASLSIGEPNSGPILDYFYGTQGIAVRTAMALTINTDLITQTVLDTIKGGGGGFGEGGIFDIRQDFVDTAYWNASVITNEAGMATFEVTLPDNLTTWRLDARAVTLGTNDTMLVGQDTFDLLSTKPLLLRPVTPRFFVVGDEVMLGAVLNNNTSEPLVVEARLEANGLQFIDEDSAAQTIVVPANGGTRVNWLVRVPDVGSADLTFFAASEDNIYTDASKPPLGQGEDRLLPIYGYEAPEITGTGGVLREADTISEAIVLPQRFNVTQGELSINVEPSLAATAISGLDYLANQPYTDIETTVSIFLPNIMTVRALDSLNIAHDALRTNLDFEINLALQRLYARQRVDGGWGWYVQDESNALVTAYALIGLVEAQRSGYPVDAGVIDLAGDYLRRQFVTPGLNIDAWRLDRQAFILYALARSGAPDVGRSVALYDSRERLSIYAKALLALTLNSAGDNEDRIDTLLSDINNVAITSANGIHWEEAERDFWNWNTNTRTTAIVLQAMVELNPQSNLIPNIVRWLMVARRADAWETTQETAWAVMSLTQWMLISGELDADYEYNLEFNDSRLISGTVVPENVTQNRAIAVDIADMLIDEINHLSISRTTGGGNLYYTAYLRVFLPVSQIEAINRGIIVQRRYTLLDDVSRQTVDTAPVGEVVQVRLTIIAPNDLHYVVVEDPIPGGAEAINPLLSTEQQIGTDPGLDTGVDPVSQGWGWWWFNNIEFRDEKVVLSSTYLPAGTYEYVYTIRTGLEGTYNVIPATAREYFFPDVFGRGEGSTFTVTPAED